MIISITNESTMVSDADIETMVAAINIQVEYHFAPAWNQLPIPVQFFSDASQIPPWAWRIHVIDNDVQVVGALGFHEEELLSGIDTVDGYICCEPILTNGGAIMAFDPSNPGQYTISGTLSHEILEVIANRYTTMWYDNGNVSICGEVCDNVEQVGYGITVNGVSVSVSDFCFPAFFNQLANIKWNAPFNYLKTVQQPFETLSGGYRIERSGGPGTEQQVFDRNMPSWRQEMKKKAFSRGGRIVK